MHNTLAASDYGLLQEYTFEPRPNDWSALLWRRLMGTTVLDAGKSPSPNLHVYAQCLRNHPGGVTLLVINADAKVVQSLTVPTASERFTLTAQELTDKQVQLNGINLKLGADDALPELKGTQHNPEMSRLRRPASRSSPFQERITRVANNEPIACMGPDRLGPGALIKHDIDLP
jgi:hypothetical protein